MDREFPESSKNLPKFKEKSLTTNLKDYRFVTLTRTILEDPSILSKLELNIQQQVKDIFLNNFDKKATRVDSIASKLKNSPFASDMIILLNQLINEGNQNLFKATLSQASWLSSRQFQKSDMSFMGGETISSEGIKGKNKEEEETSVDFSGEQSVRHGRDDPSAEQLEGYQSEFNTMITDLGAITTRGDITKSIINKIFDRIIQKPTDIKMAQWEKMKIYWFLANKQLEDANNKINGNPSSFNIVSGNKISNECGSINVKDDLKNPYKLRTLVSPQCLGKSAREVGLLKIKMKKMLSTMPVNKVKQQLLNEYTKKGYTENDLPIYLINDDNFIKSTYIQNLNYIKDKYLPTEEDGKTPVPDYTQGNRWIATYQSGLIPYFSDMLISFTKKQKEIMQTQNPDERREKQRQFDIMRKNFFGVGGVYTQVISREETAPQVNPETGEEIVNNRKKLVSRPSRGDEINNVLRAMGYPYTNKEIYQMLIGNKDLPISILDPKPRMAEAQYFIKEAFIDKIIELNGMANSLIK
jgi:hypothetical protein